MTIVGLQSQKPSTVIQRTEMCGNLTNTNNSFINISTNPIIITFVISVQKTKSSLKRVRAVFVLPQKRGKICIYVMKKMQKQEQKQKKEENKKIRIYVIMD